MYLEYCKEKTLSGTKNTKERGAKNKMDSIKIFTDKEQDSRVCSWIKGQKVPKMFKLLPTGI